MADYIYLLENRLSPAQRHALRTVRELARSKNLTVFLVGGAVRDLTSGSPVRDLDVVVQGNAPKLRKELEKLGVVITGEMEAGQALFAGFPGSVRMEIGSTLTVTYPKPGKPVYKPATILDDLRRRDFTANSMALSLNEGSYGLLMDPLNGVADIENRELRLASNYGFIEDPVRMIRAARLMARLGWSLDEKTQQRYEAGKEEGYISALSPIQRGYELEEIVHEEDPLRVLRRLESEGWMQVLAPFWNAGKVDVTGLEHLREAQTQLQMQGIHPDASAANFPLLTAKLSPKEVATLTSSFVRQGFVKDIAALESKAKDLVSQLSSKAAALPSQSWKILTSAPPEAVLWVAYSSKSAAIQAKFKSFSTVWPLARQKMPYALMQEMRIVPELPGYEDLLEKLFFELMDEKLQAPDEMKAFLEPYSPPAPPPPPSIRRARAPRKDSKAKSRARKASAASEPDAEELDPVEGSSEIAERSDEAPTGAFASSHANSVPGLGEDAVEADSSVEDDAGDSLPPVTKPSRSTKPAAKDPGKLPLAVPDAPSDSATKKPAKSVAAKSVPAKSAPAKSVSAKSVPTKASPAKAVAGNAVGVKSASGVHAPAKPVRAAAAPAKVSPSKAAPGRIALGKSPAKATPGNAKRSQPAPNPPARKAVAPVRPSSPAPKAPAKKAAPVKAPAGKSVTGKKATPVKATKAVPQKAASGRSGVSSAKKVASKLPAKKSPPPKATSKKVASATKHR